MAITKVPGYQAPNAWTSYTNAVSKANKVNANIAARPKTVSDPFGVPRAVAPSKTVLDPFGVPRQQSSLPPLGSTVPGTNNPPPNPGVISSTPYSGVPGNASRATAAVPQNFQSYLDEATNDPVYQSAVANYNNNLAGWALGRQNAIQQAAIRSGYDISGQLASDPTLAGYAGDITDTARQTALSNPMSDAAQNQKAYDNAVSNLAYEQAGRGTLASGATATGTGAALQAQQLAAYQSQNQTMQSFRDAINTYLGNQSSGQATLQGTMGDVAARLAQLDRGSYDIGDATEQNLGADQNVVDPNTGAKTNIPSAATPQPGVSWGGQQFLTKKALASYLGQRGTTYAQWAANHPTAAQQLR